MKQGKYSCDIGCVTVQIGKRNFIHYNNGVGDGEYEVFEFKSKKEFDEYCESHHVPNPYHRGVAEFYKAKVLSSDYTSFASTLFKLTGIYHIYNNNSYDYRHSGDVYFVKYL